MSLADLSRQQTVQPADLADTMELARRSTASGHHAPHAGGEDAGHSHVRQSARGEAAAGSRRPSVFGDASLSAAQHRMSVLGSSRRTSMLGASHRPSVMGGPRMSILGHAGDHRISMLGGQDHPAPVAELEEEEAPVELTPEQAGAEGCSSTGRFGGCLQ